MLAESSELDLATIKPLHLTQSGRNILASHHTQTSFTTAWTEKYHEEVTISNPPSSQQLHAGLSDRTGSVSKTACMSMQADVLERMLWTRLSYHCHHRYWQWQVVEIEATYGSSSSSNNNNIKIHSGVYSTHSCRHSYLTSGRLRSLTQ